MVETCDAWRLSPSVEFRQMRKHCSAELLLRCDLSQVHFPLPPSLWAGGRLNFEGCCVATLLLLFTFRIACLNGSRG